MAKRLKNKFHLHSTEISEHVALEGTLQTDASILLKGAFTGTIHSKSLVTIDKSSKVTTSDIEARTITVFGSVGGSLSAVESISIEDRASVSGRLRAPLIKVSDAAKFEGLIGTATSGD